MKKKKKRLHSPLTFIINEIENERGKKFQKCYFDAPLIIHCQWQLLLKDMAIVNEINVKQKTMSVTTRSTATL